MLSQTKIQQLVEIELNVHDPKHPVNKILI